MSTSGRSLQTTMAVVVLVMLAACAGQSSTASAPVSHGTADNGPEGRTTTQDEPAEPAGSDDEVIRFVSPEEQAVAMKSCVEAAGLEMVIHADGGFNLSGRPWQEHQAIIQRCRRHYPIHPSALEPLTTEQLARFYAHMVAVQVPCLTEANIRIEDVPASLDDYLAGVRTGSRFSVSAQPAFINHTRYHELFVTCELAGPPDLRG